MQVLHVFQIIIAVLLIVAILLQAQGGGLSPVFGGGGEVYRSKRNVEKFLLYGTGVLAFLLLVFSIILLIPQR
jgi:protein translocase SecG subunit